MNIADLPQWALQLAWGIVGFYLVVTLAVSVMGVSLIPIVIGLALAVVIGLVGANTTQRFVTGSD